MKVINNVLLLIILILSINCINGQVESIIFQNYTIGSPYTNEIYRDIITPFSPGGFLGFKGYHTILFNFVAYSSTLQQNITVNFYDQDSVFKFKVDDVLLQYYQGGQDTTGPTNPTTTSDATIVIYDNNNIDKNFKSIHSLKAAHESYILLVKFPISNLFYQDTNKLSEYYTIGFDLPGYGIVTFNFPDNPIEFRAPAYFGPIDNQIFQVSQTELLVDYGEPDYCKSNIILDAISISHSYGLYYVQDLYGNISIPLISIKSPTTSNSIKYYFLSKYPRSSSQFIGTYTIYDALTGQSSTISTTLICSETTALSLPADLVYLNSNSRSFMYATLNTPNHVSNVLLNSSPLQPTSIALPNGGYTTYIRIPILLGPFTVNIPREELNAIIQGPSDTVTVGTDLVTIVQISVGNSLVDNELKLNYTNSQVKFYVVVTADQSTYGKIDSIDYEYNGVVFYSDKQVVSNVYKNIIYIPDNLLNMAINQLKVYINSQSYSRVLVKTFQFTTNSPYTKSTKTLYSNQEMYIEYGKKDKYFINAFTGRLQMGTDNYQIPNVQMNYFTLYKSTSFSNFNDDVKIESSFPFGYSGYYNDLLFNPSVPLMSDTPGSSIDCDPSSPYETSISNDPLLKRDFVNPNIFANFTFGSDPTSSTPDSVFISLDDSIGISSIKPNCKVSLGPTTFTLLPSNIYSMIESNFTSTMYQFNFKFNRYFCSSSLVIDCTDIRGNRLYYNGKSPVFNSYVSSGLNGCPILKAAPLLALCYSYNSVSSITINALFVQYDPSEYSVKVLIYDNYDNIGTPVATHSLQLENSYPTTQSYTYKAIHDETFTSNSPSVKRYISIQVLSSPSSLLDSYTLSTKELEYLDSIYQGGTVTTQVVSSQFIFRNQKYYNQLNAIDILNNGYTIKLLKDEIIFASTMSDMVKSMVFVIRDKVSPIGIYLNYDSTNSKSYQIKNSTNIIVSLPTSLNLYSELYIESFCDHFNNCYELGPYMMNKAIFSSPVNPTPSTLKTTISYPKFSRNYIDVSSGNRKVKVSIDILLGSSPFVQSSIASDPLFYVTERDSNDQITCPLKQIDNSSTYSCTLDIPFMFGSRGLGHCSVYNMVYKDGYINGTRFDTCVLFLYNQYLKGGPVITEISTRMYDTTLYFYGINLNLLDSMIDDKSIFSTSTFTFINSTSGYYQLKEKLTQPLDIMIGGKVYSVFIYTCLKDDCSGNGICNMTTLSCSCNNGWGGTDCSIDQTFGCKSNCSGNGICSGDMICNCNQGYTGVACEIKNSTLSMNMNTSVISPSVTVDGFDSDSLNNFTKTAKFDIELVYIQEVNIFGDVINRFNFNETKWSLLESTNSNLSNTFNTTLLEYSDFRVRVDIFKQDTQVTWANELLSIPANSIKYSVRISNYTFTSNLNRLEMFYQATPNSALECSIKQQIAWGAKRSTDMHWVTLPNNQLQLYGKFSNNLIIDDRIVSNSNEGLEFGSTIQVKVNIPFFKDYVELDPDFSVLVDVNMDETVYDECGNIISTSNKKKWVIPVAVIVSVVGATIIFITVFSIYYKKNTTLRAKVLSLKSRFNGGNGGVSMKTFN